MQDRIVVKVEAELQVLVPRFLANRRRDVETIERSLAEHDFATIRATGHNIKGVGGGYGFPRISDLGKAIEEAAKAQDGEAVAALAAQFRAYLARVDVQYI